MKEKNYKLRSKVYKGIGNTLILTSTTCGFLAYESMVNWQNFKKEIDNFVVINEQTMQINLTLAFPILVGMIIFLFVMLKKNKEFFKNKASMNLLIAIFIMYLIYSVVEVTLFSLIGAFVGTFIDEFGIAPIVNINKQKAQEQKEINIEYDKELRRIKARKMAGEDFNGSV